MTIVAIGGGEISERETIEIDKEIVDTADSNSPKALFIPTASGDAEGYIKIFEKIYGEELNCEVAALKPTLVTLRPPEKQVP